jgi:hypothetical protein
MDTRTWLENWILACMIRGESRNGLYIAAALELVALWESSHQVD